MQNPDSLPDLNEDASEMCENPFLASLRALTPKDIPLGAPEPRAPRRFDTFSILRVIALCICAAALLYSISRLVYQFAGSSETNDTYSDLSNRFWGNSVLSQARKDPLLIASPDYAASQTVTDFSQFITPPTYNEELEQVKARLGALKEINPEIWGYIHIENTNIDYPIVRHADNEYYLKHDFTGKYSSRGSIFTDFRNYASLMDNRNIILYGHHMTTGSDMFKTLDNYFDESFFQNNPDITIYTFDGIYRFRVFAAYITPMDYHYIQTFFATDDAFVAFCEEMRSNSLFVRDDISFDPDTPILTLSTCTNIVKTERIAIQAVMVSREN